MFFYSDVLLVFEDWEPLRERRTVRAWLLMYHEADSRRKPFQRCMYQEHRTSHGRHARIGITTILHNAPQLHSTSYILHTQYAPNLVEVPGARMLLPKSSRSSPFPLF